MQGLQQLCSIFTVNFTLHSSKYKRAVKHVGCLHLQEGYNWYGQYPFSDLWKLFAAHNLREAVHCL